MNKNKNTKGLTFIEVIITVTLLTIVSLFLLQKIRDYNERMDLELATRKIQHIFLNYTNKSFYEKNRYILEINNVNHKIIIKKIDDTIVEEHNLPEKVYYEIPYDNKRNPIFKVQTNRNGNLNKAFTLYIFGYKKNVKKRLAFYIFQKEKVLKINSYTNKNVVNINYENILEYHYSSNGQNRIGWEEEI